jgi:hypothetical protein
MGGTSDKNGNRWSVVYKNYLDKIKTPAVHSCNNIYLKGLKKHTCVYRYGYLYVSL